MHLTRYTDPMAFRDAVEDHLLGDEPRHNLIIGLLRVLIEQPEVYADFALWAVTDDHGATACAGLRKPPHLVVISAPTSDAALDTMVEAIASEPEPVPGVLGGLPEANEFAIRYAAATGRSVSKGMEQGIYALEQVADVPRPAGAPRVAGPDDVELVLEWTRAFHAEAGPVDTWDEAQTRRRLAGRLAGRGGEGLRIWEDGGPVCLAGFAGPTRHGIRVGPVYTPPELRKRGYATALVADVSQELLDSGRRFCFLYTDMSNPTSNAVYRRIGYRLACCSAMIRFE